MASSLCLAHSAAVKSLQSTSVSCANAALCPNAKAAAMVDAPIDKLLFFIVFPSVFFEVSVCV